VPVYGLFLYVRNLQGSTLEMAEALVHKEALKGLTSKLPRDGWLAYVGTLLSLAICYFNAIFVAPLLGVGTSWTFNPHVQSVLMWSFGLFAVVAIYRDRDKHGDWRPFFIASIGLVGLVGTLYTFYHDLILEVSYFMLLVGTFANQNSILKKLHVKSQLQATELAEWNQTLESRVAEQVAELDRVGQLKRFLSPEVADLIVAQGDNSLLESHRCYVATLFCDLRGFTKFSDRAEPEEVIDVLQNYHQLLGRLVMEYGGTVNHRAGDGLMVIFNDPLPCDEPVRRATELAFSARDDVGELTHNWAKLGYQLGFGIGIAAGYATLGIIGDKLRSDYTAIGNVINLASRLCDKAQDSEILVSQRAYLDIENTVKGKEVTGLKLKGFSQLHDVYSINP
jgi:class 3 adenylate cyclase